jgi:endonuclease/exonuclease/phosphatase family metal-dependent hydrolase
MVFFNDRSLHRILGFRSFIKNHVQAGPDMLSRMRIMQCNQRSSPAEARATRGASAMTLEEVPNKLSVIC